MGKQNLQAVAHHLNALGDYLSMRDIGALTAEALYARYGIKQVDLMILFGGSIPYGCIAAGRAFQNGIARRLLIVGGEGHTTPYLRREVASRHPEISTEGRMEADIIADLLYQEVGLDSKNFLIERDSRNCGENAVFAYHLAKANGIRPGTVLLMQDSSMQRRMDATFQKVWTGWPVTFINYAAYRARVCVKKDQLAFEDDSLWGMWSMQHYITLLLGEIPRLRDTEEGYGPLGKNYLAHVDLPNEVISAFEALQEQYADLVRKPWQSNS